MTRSMLRRLSDWIWQGEAIETARAELVAKSTRRQALENYARLAGESGDRALDPITPLRAGSGRSVAARLYKDSIAASLRAAGVGADTIAPDGALSTEIEQALPTGITLERVRELLEVAGTEDDLQSVIRVREADARALKKVASVLIRRARGAERRMERAWVRRVYRVGCALVFAIVVVLGALSLGRELALPPDLAENKPWRASSEYAGFSATEGVCDGRKTAIFFHTKREPRPWVEIDLEKETAIRRVDVKNRRDCCHDRAWPLVIEGSIDGKEWTELARKKGPFYAWTAEFPETKVRYVRARALKRTYLHLESIAVR